MFSLAVLVGFAVIAVSGLVYDYRRRQPGYALRAKPRFSGPFWFYAGVGVCLFISAWFLLARVSGPTVLPTPTVTVRALYDLFLRGSLATDLMVSFKRIVIGFGAATLIGVPLGLVLGTYPAARLLVLPSNTLLRYIPPTALVTLFISYFGLGELLKYAIVFLACFFFIVQMTVDAVADIDKHYFEIGLTSGFRSARLFFSIVLPASVPRLIDVLRINMSACWAFLVVAEIVGAEQGIGKLIVVSQRVGHVDEVYACLLVTGIVGLLLDRAFTLARIILCPWKRTVAEL